MANGVTAKLEHASFVATAADIEALVKEQLVAATTSVRNRTTYLRALVATTQDKLGITPRVRQGHMTKLSPEDQKVQLEALENVHTDFYTAVQKAIEETPLSDEEKPKTGRTSSNAIKTRRATFARSAASTVRGWIKAGRDIGAIAAAKVTKAMLHVGGPRRKRAMSAKRLITRAEKQSKDLIGTLLLLADTDKEAGLKEFQTTMDILSSQLVQLGVAVTRDAAVAAAEHRPLQVGRGSKTVTFVPTASQVLRQQARPS